MVIEAQSMGLEASEIHSKMETVDKGALAMSAAAISSLMGIGGTTLSTSCAWGASHNTTGIHPDASDQDNGQMQLLLQARALLKRGAIYQKVDGALQKSHVFRPSVYTLPHATEVRDDDHVTSLHRDAAVSNLRFLNIFYGYHPDTFVLAVNLLDRILGKVKAHPRYLSCIAVACFDIAAKTQEVNVFIPTTAELVKLSQCGGSAIDMGRMRQLVLEKLCWQVAPAVTPLTFLRLFHELFTDLDPLAADPTLLNSLVAKLTVIMCQFEFTKYRAETLALSLLSSVLQEMGLLNSMQCFSAVVELQCYCQISDAEFLQCRGMVSDYLTVYLSQRSRLPRLQLQWTVSRRTLHKMKPSTRVLLDLEPIMEDEDDDGGTFDSENSDNEAEKRTLLQLRSHLSALAQAAALRQQKKAAEVAASTAKSYKRDVTNSINLGVPSNCLGGTKHKVEDCQKICSIGQVTDNKVNHDVQLMPAMVTTTTDNIENSNM